jgi:hypothetical protein
VGRYNLAIFILRNIVKGRDAQVLDKSTIHAKTLGARVKTGRIFLTEDPQILSANVKKLVATATWTSGSVNN